MTPEPPLANPTRARATTEQLIWDLSCMWLDRYDRACQLPRDGMLNDRIWRTTAISIVDSWTVLYLLGQLRTHAPAVAEHAAEFLNYGTPNLDADRMPEYVRDWATAVADGQSLLGRLP